MDENEPLRALREGIEFGMAFIELEYDDPELLSKALANSALISLKHKGFKIIRTTDQSTI